MRPSIRAARVEDIAELHRIRLAVRENRLTDPSLVTKASYLPYLTGRGAAWVAEQGGSPVGFAILDLDEARVWALFVAPESEGKGVGMALLDELRRFASSHGLERLRLVTGAGTRAARFYERNGWVCVGNRGNGEIEFEWSEGRPCRAGSDAAPANELGPSPPERDSPSWRTPGSHFILEK